MSNYTRSLLVLVPALLLVGCVATEEEMAQDKGLNQAAFGRIDHDGDGRVSKTELAGHMHREALAEFDLDNDRQISREEWRVTHQNPKMTDEPFDRLDQDGDGDIGEVEAVRFITEHASFGEAFQALDRDDDKHLLWEEYIEGGDGILSLRLFSIQSE